MANKRTTLVITHNTESLQTAKDLLLRPASKPRAAAVYVQRFFEAISIGGRSAKYTAQVDNGDAATAIGTFTFSGIAAAGDTILINGVTITCVASGPTNNQFIPGATSAQTAANLAAAIASSTSSLISQSVTASSLASVVTVSAIAPGSQGNTNTIAKGVDAGSVNTVSGARLSGGSNATGASVLNTYRLGL